MSSSNCCFLACIQVSQEAGQVALYSHLFKNSHQFIMIHIVKGFDRVNKAEIDVSLELSCFFNDPADIGNLISGSSAFSKTSLNIWKFSVHVLLKSGLENFEHYLTGMWDECNCVVVWTFFRIAFLRDWNENWPFPVLWPLLCPMSESPSRREKASKTMQLAKRGSLLLTRARALCCIQRSGAGQRAPSPSCYTNL